MTIQTQYDLDGLSEFQAAINQKIRELESALPGIVRNGANIVEKEIEIRAPKKSGELISELDVIEESGNGRASATVQVDHSGPNGAAHHAIFQEYGTSKMPANPFFRPGVEAAKPKVADSMTKDILKVIEK